MKKVKKKRWLTECMRGRRLEINSVSRTLYIDMVLYVEMGSKVSPVRN